MEADRRDKPSESTERAADYFTTQLLIVSSF